METSMISSSDFETTNRNAWREEIIAFEAKDGFACNLIHVQGAVPATKGPVLLVHGAGVRANVFRAPVDTTIVDYLVEHGYDVWLENWRASIDLPFNSWTLDQAAVYDHPAAVETVIEQTGARSVKAVIHCQGSTSFMMSAVAGLLPQVSVIVSNAVSLHTIIPRWSSIKMPLSVPLLRRLTPYLDPQWGIEAPTLVAKTVAELVRLSHHECNNLVCKMVSFTYGSGFPALWSHANLNEETHDWLRQEFAKVPISFFEQMVECVRAGHLVPVDGLKELPSDLFHRPPQTDARFAFFAGANNHCFLPESQQKTFEWFNQHAANRHTLHLMPNYGHLDVFMGKDASRDIFPAMYQELEKQE
jgi:pimeloyl-ACP methyl ester carboxylesterase